MKRNSEQLTESLSLSATDSEKAWHIFFSYSLHRQAHSSPGPRFPMRTLPRKPRSDIFPLFHPKLSHHSFRQAFRCYLFNRPFFFCRLLSPKFHFRDAFTWPPIPFGGFPKIWLGKRKRDEDEKRKLVLSSKRNRNSCTKVYYHLTDDISRIVELSNPLFLVNNIVLNPCLLAESSARQLNCKVEGIENVESEMNVEDYRLRNVSKELVASEPEAEPNIPTRKADREMEIRAIKINPIYSPNCDEQSNISVVVDGKFYVDCATTNLKIADNEVNAEGSKKEEKLDLGSKKQGVEDLSPSFNVGLSNIPLERDWKSLDEDNCNHKMPYLGEEHPTVQQELVLCILIPSSMFLRSNCQNLRRRQRLIRDQPKPKVLPEFESYIVEDEEGSGGYGNVYRARRKNDGTLVAIKYKSKLGYDLSFHHNIVPAKAIHPANNSKGADGSGITSAKDVSGRTPSAERLREPLPCQGKMDTGSSSYSNACELNYLCYFWSRLYQEQRSCSDLNIKVQRLISGLLGSLYSTMIGKSPFFGDPVQNIKDIAKLRGSEDLWEVAKLHNRESSFPEDLYCKQSLTSMNLRDWCQMNTKRQDFLQEIPSSLYSLDKCLTVNPRLRITTEDALKHEFFALIHENLRKQRAFKQGLSLDSGTNNHLLGERITKSFKASIQKA
ncbi:hypothetical protein CRYUN_Cryun12cG0023100 [Craigia yunnanensis]